MVILETIKVVKDGTDGYKLELYAKTDGGGVVKVATLAGGKIALLKPTTITGNILVSPNNLGSSSIAYNFTSFQAADPTSSNGSGGLKVKAENNAGVGATGKFLLDVSDSNAHLYDFGLRVNNIDALSIDRSGNVNLLKPTTINGAAIGTHKLAVNGTAANTTGVWATLSDEAVKENIKDVSNPIDKVLKIANCVKQYNYITETGIEQNQRTQFIAQMLIENGFEGHVSESDPMNEDVGRILGWEYADEEYTETETNEEGNEKEVVKTRRVVTKEGRQQYSVEQNLTPYLFPAFAELKKENDELKERLSIIEKKLGI